MRRLALTLAAAIALPVAAQQEGAVPPPPPPPPRGVAPLPPPPHAAERAPKSGTLGRPLPPGRPGTIGENPVAPAGSQAAPLHPDESVSHWRFSLATGVAGRFGGDQIVTDQQNSK